MKTAILLVTLFFLIHAHGTGGQVSAGDDKCTKDRDCIVVPESCCSNMAVNAKSATDYEMNRQKECSKDWTKYFVPRGQAVCQNRRCIFKVVTADRNLEIFPCHQNARKGQ